MNLKSYSNPVGSLLFLLCATSLLAAANADSWTNVSGSLLEGLTNQGVKLAWPGGCSGVVANRRNGEVTIKVVGQGLWRTSDLGVHWTRIDQNTVSGRDETGWATSVDQEDPRRMASFSLDGLAGWTLDGANWTSFANNGRNWDYGSVDWGTPTPKTILVAKHETSPAGEIDLSTDGGRSWRKLGINLSGNRAIASMVGVINATTLIYGNGKGILRSTDEGATWNQVSTNNPLTRIPVRFHGATYLGTAQGLLVSKDLGLTWQSQGQPVSIWLGPFFGADEKQIAVVGTQGIHVTQDGGQTWQRVGGLKPSGKGASFSVDWFGSYTWDPIHKAIYASAMGNPVYRLSLEIPSDR